MPGSRCINCEHVMALTTLGSRVTVGMVSMNEEEAVVTVIKAIKIAIPNAEILIVDSSLDQTPIIAARMGARVIRQYPPCGYGVAMMRVLRESTREVVVTYVIVQCIFVSWSAFSTDDFWLAYHNLQYKNTLPYRNFSPYKSVLGY